MNKDKLENVKYLKGDDWTAAFLNHKNAKVISVEPLGLFKQIKNNEFIQLCKVRYDCGIITIDIIKPINCTIKNHCVQAVLNQMEGLKALQEFVQDIDNG